MEQKQKKKINLKLIIIILVIVILLIVGGSVGYYFVTGNSVLKVFESFKKEEEFTTTLSEFTVNLNNESSKSYLKTQIALMYTDKKDEEILTNNNSKIRDVIIKDLRTKNKYMLSKSKDLRFVKDEIMTNINTILKKEVVKDVYFINFIIQ